MNEQPPQFPNQGPYAQPQPQFQPQPLPPLPPPPKHRSFFKSTSFLVILIVIALGALGSLIWFTSGHTGTTSLSNASHESSLTLYYDDGKTVLWRTGTSTTNNPAPAFVAYVQNQLRTQYGASYLSKGSWSVTTTLDKNLQAAAVKQLQTQQAAFKQQDASDAALVAENVTNGQMVSWVGNLDNQGTQDNTQAQTAVGTLQLPFTYATYLTDTSNTLNTTLDDAQMALPDYPCNEKGSPFTDREANCLWDLDYKYMGSMTAYQALAQDRLVPATEAAFSVVGSPAEDTPIGPATSTSNANASVNKVIALTDAMGSDAACYQPSYTSKSQNALGDKTQCGGAATIGFFAYAIPQRTLQAYATLANSGQKLPQTVLLKVLLNGSTKYVWTQPKDTRVISNTVAQNITGALSDSSASWLQAEKTMFTTTDGTKTAISYGTDGINQTVSTVQFSQKYAAGLWVYGQQSESNAVAEQMSTLLIPVTYNWFNVL